MMPYFMKGRGKLYTAALGPQYEHGWLQDSHVRVHSLMMQYWADIICLN